MILFCRVPLRRESFRRLSRRRCFPPFPQFESRLQLNFPQSLSLFFIRIKNGKADSRGPACLPSHRTSETCLSLALFWKVTLCLIFPILPPNFSVSSSTSRCCQLAETSQKSSKMVWITKQDGEESVSMAVCRNWRRLIDLIVRAERMPFI
jgi:hypothetical protein